MSVTFHVFIERVVAASDRVLFIPNVRLSIS